MSDVLEFRGVGKVYRTGPVWHRHRVEAIRDVSFRIGAGETLALVGESGSGKTTISKLCLGLIAPSSGEILLESRPRSKDVTRLRGRFLAVLQNPGASMNPKCTVAWSILEPIRVVSGLRGLNGPKRVAELLEMVGLLKSHADRYPHELSGGPRSRSKD